VKILETERLLLRRLIPGDLNALAALYADPEIRRYFPDGTLTRDETREELAWFLDGHPEHPELGLWATLRKSDGAFLGRCGLLPWTIDGRLETEIAYLFGKEYWRQGFGREVAQALVRHGFEALGLTRLIALIDPAHTASIRTAESAGLSFERQVRIEGVDSALYSITRAARS
jgi:ribosomal-protein-alanine N-acetyltransferase